MSGLPDELPNNGAPKEVLVVASKLKKYIKEKSGLATSAGVINVLSDLIREHCDEAIENAKNADRKTVLDRDFVKKV